MWAQSSSPVRSRINPSSVLYQRVLDARWSSTPLSYGSDRSSLRGGTGRSSAGSLFMIHQISIPDFKSVFRLRKICYYYGMRRPGYLSGCNYWFGDVKAPSLISRKLEEVRLAKIANGTPLNKMQISERLTAHLRNPRALHQSIR